MTTEISKTTLKYIETIASNKKVQAQVLEAMFSGCEPDTDIYEWCDFEKVLSREESKMLWGHYPEWEETEDDNGESSMDWECLSCCPSGTNLLIKTIKNKLIKRLK